MIIVAYRSKRQLKKAIGQPLNFVVDFDSAEVMLMRDNDPLLVTNMDGTFKATVTMVDGKIVEVR